MAYRDGHAPSWGPKVSLLILVLLGALFSTRLIMNCGRMDAVRQIMFTICAWLFLVRLAACLLVFLKRKLSWFEGVTVGILYCGLLCGFAFWGSGHAATIVALDAAAIFLYVGGSWINTLADCQRHSWKRRQGNAGRLYEQGLFRYAMHINFFGDTLMFLGFAMITHDLRSLVPMVAIIANFVLLQIPQLDDYLGSKYGEEFARYANRTRKYIPLVY